LYDVDATNELVLAELRIGGQMRKVVMNGNKNGYFYVIDRTNGKLIAAHAMTRINWATHVDLKTGRPVLTDIGDRLMKGEEVEVYPQRGTNAIMFAFNPKSNLAYLNTWDLPRIQKFVPYKFEKMGEPNTATAGRPAVVKPGDVVGYHAAMDVVSGKFKWKIPITDVANSASLLVTDGGVIFTGKPTGEFIALDEATGKQLWQFKTSSSINAPPITYTHKGVQYVTIASGLAGSLPRGQAANLVPSGSSVWTFALMRN
jgi:alcohol dehydrogenase (cytochrome c)